MNLFSEHLILYNWFPGKVSSIKSSTGWIQPYKLAKLPGKLEWELKGVLFFSSLK
jgi:hypothetical protein